jgi:hypothetical protein
MGTHKKDIIQKEEIKLTNKEKDILNLALTKLDEYYDEQEKTCRNFKWICHDHLPQAGDDYVANKNVFDIEEKTIGDIKKAKEKGRQTIMKLINGL